MSENGDQVEYRSQDAVNMPSEIGGYKILRVLGSGGMSIVYAALQRQPRRMVALKVMKQGTTTSISLRRFRREIEILGRLHHPYIAQVFDAGMHDDGSGGVPYFVMEYVPGARTIVEHVVAKDLDQRQTLKLFVKICAAVEHGHHNKVVHRDLKPGNILIDRVGDPKIIDFGVARATEAGNTATMQTEAGRLVGTIQFMAPEQVDAQPHDIRPSCDVYALGILLYKLMTRRYPHTIEGLPIYEAVRIIRLEDPPRASTVNPNVKGDLETIMMRCLEKEPARRYQTAGKLGRDILRFLGKVPIKARPAGLVYRIRLLAHRRRALLALIASMALLVIVVAGVTTAIVLGLRPETTEPPSGSDETVASVDPSTEVDEVTLPANEVDGRDETSASAETPATSPYAGLVLQGLEAPVTNLALMSNSVLVSQSGDHLSFWDLKTQEFRPLVVPIAPPRLFASSGPAAQRVAVSSGTDRIFLIDTSTAEIARTIPVTGANVQSLAISHDGSLVAYSLDDLTIRIWSGDRTQRRTIRSSVGDITALTFDAHNTLLVGAGPGRLGLWSLGDRLNSTQMNGVEEPMLLSCVGDTGQLLVVDRLGVGRFWDVGAALPLSSLAPPQTIGRPIIILPNAPSALAVASNGTMLAASHDERVVVWKLEGDKKRITSRRLDESPTALEIVPEQGLLILGFASGEILMRRIEPEPNRVEPVN